MGQPQPGIARRRTVPMATVSAPDQAPRPLSSPLVHNGLVKWHLIAAFGWLTLAMLDGLFFSTAVLMQPLDAAHRSRSSRLARIRMVHTNLVAFGFLVQRALTAMLYWTCAPD